MSITSIDQNFITNDDDYLFTFLNNEVSNSLEYSSTNSESSSPQATSSSSPENCSWDLFEFESDFLPQVKKEDKFSNSSCFSNISNLYPTSLGNDTKSNKETGKKRTFDDLLGEPDVKCQTKLENSQITPNNPPRTISIEEEKKLKKQRRLIKNRESAQLSRLRKKQYIENLENQVKKLANENAILNKHIETVQTQNLALQEENLYLRGVLNQNKQDQNLPNLKARNTATAGVCLLLILFSFGLFFNQSQNTHSPLALPSAPSVPQTFYKGLTLKEQPPPPLPEPPKNDQSSLQPQSNNELDPKPKRAKIQVINEEEDDLVISPTRTSTFSSSPPPNAVSSISDESNLKPSNNSYIYCPEAHQFINEDSTASSDDFDFPVVSLLLPSVSLNGILPEINEHISNPEQTLLEVSCKILNINVYPFFPDVSSGSFVPPIAIGSL